MTALYLLASTMGLVFALGLQSQLVNNGHYLGAFLNSLAIGAGNLVLFKLAPTASGWEIAAYMAGGPFGIVASMAAYRSGACARLVQLRGAITRQVNRIIEQHEEATA